MRTTRLPLVGSSGPELALTYIAMACPDLHSDAHLLGIPSDTLLQALGEVYDVNKNSNAVRSQAKCEAIE
jgi:hypothetical protein